MYVTNLVEFEVSFVEKSGFSTKKVDSDHKNRFFRKKVYFVKESGFLPPRRIFLEEKKIFAEESFLAGNG